MTQSLSMKKHTTIWWLPYVYDWLEGGTGEGVCLLGGGGLGYLLPERLWQAALKEFSASPELLIILGVFRAFTAALVKDGHHRWPPPNSLLLAE